MIIIVVITKIDCFYPKNSKKINSKKSKTNMNKSKTNMNNKQKYEELEKAIE